MPTSESEPIRIGLALGGGAVRGAAHIGVLDVLDRAGLEPAVLTGTSAGALVGALYASGATPSEISKLAHTLRWAKLVRPARTRKALFETSKLAVFLDAALGGRDFEALDRPFAAIACDLTTGARVVMRDGPVSTAVLASAAIPGVFPPVERDVRLLIDGSVVDLVPAELARELGADIMGAVSTLQPGGPQLLTETSDLVLSPDVDGYAFWELSRISEFEDAGRAAAEQALPLLKALTETAAIRRDWQRGSS